MNKRNNKQNKFEHFSKNTITFMTILWVISMVLEVYTIIQPQYIEQKVQTNSITQITNFDYESEKLPDGIQSIQGSIFPKIQKKINISINSVITSELPIKVEGTYSIVLKVIFDGLWEQTIPLIKQKKIKIVGTENQIIKEQVNIDLEKVYNDTKIIANEIMGSSPDQYSLKIQPIIEGNAIYENKKVQLDKTPNITFEFTPSKLNLIQDQLKEFTQKTPIEEIEIINNSFNIFGIKATMPTAIYIFSFIFLSISILLILIVISKLKIKKQRIVNNIEEEKKYKNRLIQIKKQIDKSSKIDIALQSLDSLVRIGDEKDQGVLKYYSSEENRTYYYLIDGSYIYSYVLQHNLKKNN